MQVNFNLRSISMEKSKNNEVNDKVLQSTAESLNILDFFKKASPDYNGSNTEKQARINTLLKGLPLDVAEKVYVLIRERMNKKGFSTFPSSYKELVNVLRQGDNLVLEDFTGAGIPKEAVAIMLLNLMIGPAQKMKDDIDESEEKKDTAVIALYGAAAPHIKKRVLALEELSKKVNLDNGIIISGGRSWTSIVPKKYREDIEKEYNRMQIYPEDGTMHESNLKRELDRAVVYRMKSGLSYFIKELGYNEDNGSDIVDAFFGEDGANKLRSLVYGKAQEKGVAVNIKSIEDLFWLIDRDGVKQIQEIILKKVIDDKVKDVINNQINLEKKKDIEKRADGIIKNIPEVTTYVHKKNEKIWMDLLDREIEEIRNQKNISKKDKIKLKELGKMKENGYQATHEQYIQKRCDEIKKNEKEKYEEIQRQRNQNSVNFDEWLKSYVEHEYIKDTIIHGLTEVEAIQLDWNQYESKKTIPDVIEDRKATNTNENAVNTIEEFLKLREKNPEIKDLIVISDWQYLLRQMLTTRKAARDKGIDDINIIGYPACAIKKRDGQGVALQGSIDDVIVVLLGELDKIGRYNDAGDEVLPSNTDYDLDKGNLILVDGKKLTIEDLEAKLSGNTISKDKQDIGD